VLARINAYGDLFEEAATFRQALPSLT